MTGLIIVNKPEGITSFGVVARARRILGEKKIGHSGTLDPMATGVMVLLLGGATRFCELLPSHDKAYEASFRTGIVTDTLDITGKILETRDKKITAPELKKEAENFRGTITQVPPMYSAVSVGGQRLYDLARQGVEVERPERQVEIRSLEITAADDEKGEYSLSVECSGGTYIRTLIADMGENLGCGAVLTALKRTKANGFTLEDAVTLEEMEKLRDEGRLGEILIPVEKAFESCPAVSVTPAQAKRFSNGGELSLERVKGCESPGIYRVLDPGGKFLGLGENNGGADLEVRRVYVG